MPPARRKMNIVFGARFAFRKMRQNFNCFGRSVSLSLTLRLRNFSIFNLKLSVVVVLVPLVLLGLCKKKSGVR